MATPCTVANPASLDTKWRCILQLRRRAEASHFEQQGSPIRSTLTSSGPPRRRARTDAEHRHKTQQYRLASRGAAGPEVAPMQCNGVHELAHCVAACITRGGGTGLSKSVRNKAKQYSTSRRRRSNATLMRRAQFHARMAAVCGDDLHHSLAVPLHLVGAAHDRDEGAQGATAAAVDLVAVLREIVNARLVQCRTTHHQTKASSNSRPGAPDSNKAAPRIWLPTPSPCNTSASVARGPASSRSRVSDVPDTRCTPTVTERLPGS